MPELMTLEEIADYLRLNEKTIYRLLNEDNIPAIKIGHLWRFKKSAIDKWLNKKSAGKTAKILVIDDDETICSLFKATLEEAGHSVTTTCESPKGLELAKEGDFDIIFLDLKMPVMDGTETFKFIREAKPEVPVTIVTGYTDSDLMMKTLAYGPFSVIVKPFKGDDVISSVNKYLRFGMLNK